MLIKKNDTTIGILKALGPISLILRLAVPFTVFTSPYFATITILVLDWADCSFYNRWGFNRKEYNLIDKTLDLYWYIFILIYSFSYLPLFGLLFILFVYRLVGTFIYFIKRDDKIFIYFPNVFENVFYFLLILQFLKFYDYLLQPKYFIPIFLICFVVRMIFELLAHKWDYKTRKYWPWWMESPKREKKGFFTK